MRALLPRRSFSVLLTAACALTGCHLLFEQFEVGTQQPVLTTLCAAGSTRCVGPWLFECSENGAGWTERDTCDTAAHCDSGQGRCRACVPETHHCDGQFLEVCDADGNWSRPKDCGSMARCHLNSDSCRACRVGEWQCNDDVLLQCLDQGDGPSWVQQGSACAPGSCSVSEDGMSATCKPAQCNVPGEYQCDGNKLSRCSQSGRLIEVELCDDPVLCNAEIANRLAGQEQLPGCQNACEPGTVRCSGAVLDTCTEAGWVAGPTCGSPAECNVTARGCAPCTVGSFECSDGELRQCTADHSWTLVEDCGAAVLCDAGTGECRRGNCPKPGQTECRADGLHVCRVSDGTTEWVNQLTCDTSALCNANDAACDAAVCARGTSRCWNNSRQRCRDDLTGWDVVEQCADDETCELDGCQPDGCVFGSFRCNHRYLETCEDGSWQRLERCATYALCNADAGECQEPVCDVGEFQCVNTFLSACKPARDDWDELINCADEQLTCSPTLGACVE